MRKHKDKRNDKIIKEELFGNLYLNTGISSQQLMNRPRIVRLWHDIGIPNVISVQKDIMNFKKFIFKALISFKNI